MHVFSFDPATTPLVGREAAVDRLRGLVRATTAGASGCLIVSGEAGIGKSRLLDETARIAGREGIGVIGATATELDRVTPLATLAGALSQCDPPVLDDGMRAELAEHAAFPYRQRELLVGALRDYAAARPVLVALDDIQWADEATAGAVRAMVPALAGLPVGWLLVGRPMTGGTPMYAAVEGLLECGAGHLALDALPDDAVHHLAAQLLGGRPDACIRNFADRAGGNPFLLRELCTSLAEAGRVRVADGVATVGEDALPESFRARTARRLRHLSPPARRLLEAGAVLGRPFQLREAAAMVGTPVPELARAAEEALVQGNLIDTGTALAFRHDLIRQAVYDGLAGPVKQALHYEAGSVLRAAGHPAAETARHLVWGARPGDPEAIAVLRSASDETLRTSPGLSADLLLQMLGLMPAHHPDRPDAVGQAVRRLTLAGRIGESLALGEETLRERMPAAGEAAIRLALIASLRLQGRDRQVFEHARLALATGAVTDRQRAVLLAQQAVAIMFWGLGDGADPARLRAEEFALEAVDIGERTGDHAAMLHGSCARSWALIARGRIGDGVLLAEQAMELGRFADRGQEWFPPHLWLANALTAAERFDEACTVIDAGLREAERHETTWAIPVLRYYRAVLWRTAGRTEEALAEAEAALVAAEELTVFIVADALLVTLALLELQRGDLPAARVHLARARRYVDRGVITAIEDMRIAAALLQAAEGDPHAALKTAEPVYDAFPKRLWTLAYDPWLGPELVRIALRAGAPDRAAAAATASRRLADLNPQLRTAEAAALHAEGLLGGDHKLLLAAVDAYRGAPRRLALAAALQDAAAVEPDRAQAIGLWDEALQIYTDADLPRLAAPVLSALRALGVRRRSPRANSRPTEGWEAITPAELRVVRLVAEGRTNRDIAQQLHLSPHTVDAHLRHAFAKLGVSNRIALTRVAAEHLPPGA
ncbi:ATP-binding protein [Yinghuangia soli]|uniref:AAA family ATPase n=1 Tax=Yinghuangia soli TaxID=2908204 RepID=A0AA41QA50_9ACTN|nr:LuxR family transcriptional regulator [Yinghuangia soli]MCF2533184.1 AAA family ATPase [Yinghuangia soli]